MRFFTCDLNSHRVARGDNRPPTSLRPDWSVAVLMCHLNVCLFHSCAVNLYPSVIKSLLKGNDSQLSDKIAVKRVMCLACVCWLANCGLYSDLGDMLTVPRPDMTVAVDRLDVKWLTVSGSPSSPMMTTKLRVSSGTVRCVTCPLCHNADMHHAVRVTKGILL